MAWLLAGGVAASLAIAGVTASLLLGQRGPRRPEGQAASDAAQLVARANLPARSVEMIAFPAADVAIGDDNAPPDERPAFAMHVGPFRLDKSPVTVAQFRSFIEATGYKTQADKDHAAGVFVRGIGQWRFLDGADWRHPQGPEEPAAPDDHPVTQVSWEDATAFCQSYGLRLPTEFEWERAAQLGQTADGTVFRAGTRLSIEGKFRANVWQGLFPVLDVGEDGFIGTSPVGSFGAAPSGLTDMAGNVWEWTSSSYLPYPAAEHETREPAPERVQRGGSFLCSPDNCQGFRVSARSHSTPDTALMHVGFRCAGDVPASRKPGD